MDGAGENEESRESLPHESQRMTPKLIEALGHPIRRELLRELHRAGEEMSPTQLCEIVGKQVSNVDYHINVLADRGILRRTKVRRVRGFKQNFYVSEVSEHKQVASILADTEKGDRWPGK